jgi:DNA-binding response OmpR family regulator
MSRILIVEDEEFLSKALSDNFEAEGFSVSRAQNGEVALTQIEKQKPDMILLDLLLPRKGGFEVLEELKKNPDWSLIPVVVLSNLGGDEQIKRALEMGADDYFVKSQHPIEEVIEKVKSTLQGGEKSFKK